MVLALSLGGLGVSLGGGGACDPQAGVLARGTATSISNTRLGRRLGCPEGRCLYQGLRTGRGLCLLLGAQCRGRGRPGAASTGPGLHSARSALRGPLSPSPSPGFGFFTFESCEYGLGHSGLWDALPPCSDSRGPQGSADTEEQGALRRD